MRKKSLRATSIVVCLVFIAVLFLQPALEAAQSIPVNVGGQTFEVTPGQWVSVRQGTHVSHYNVRFVNGRPVALTMEQHTRLVFGDAVAGTPSQQAGQTAQSKQAAAQAAQSKQTAAQAAQSKQTAAQAAQSKQTAAQAAQSKQTAAQAAQSNQTAAQTSTARPRDPNTGRFISQEEAIRRGIIEAPGSKQAAASKQAATDAAQSKQTAAQAAQSKQTAAQAAQSKQTAAQAAQSKQTAAQAAQSKQTAAQAAQSKQTAAQAAQSKQAAAASQGAGAEQAAQTSAWDPSRHPRDPQTGRFISHEEAIQRGLMEAPAGDASQAAQSKQAAAASKSRPGLKETAGTKFQSGYATGKAMTQQGFQNVKTSFKSGFSPKSILMVAGITVGVDLATQIMRGEAPSARRALQTVASAEFVGGVGGAITGAAAGSFFVPFLSAVPVVGGALSALAPVFGAVVGSSMGAYLAGDLRNGRFSIREAFRRVDWVGVTGQAIGSTVGMALGSALGPIGTIAGGMIGGYLGNWAAQRIAGMFGRGQAQLPEIAMPIGARGGGANPAGGFGSVITIGAPAPDVSGGVSPAEADADAPLVIGAPDAQAQVIGDLESEVAMAYTQYQEYYMLYNELLRQGRQEDALDVAVEMNAAKERYDELRAMYGQ